VLHRQPAPHKNGAHKKGPGREPLSRPGLGRLAPLPCRALLCSARLGRAQPCRASALLYSADGGEILAVAGAIFQDSLQHRACTMLRCARIQQFQRGRPTARVGRWAQRRSVRGRTGPGGHKVAGLANRPRLIAPLARSGLRQASAWQRPPHCAGAKPGGLSAGSLAVVGQHGFALGRGATREIFGAGCRAKRQMSSICGG